ncbi:MAG TPA: cytidylate kinase-like family protein [Solirubrobacterales bacterium]|jgi:cytidylate kinase
MSEARETPQPASGAGAVHGRPPAAGVITISATYGAGGSVIGPALARRLEVPLLARVTASPDALAHRREELESLSPEERRTIPVHRLLASLTAAVPAGPTMSPPSARHQDEELHRQNDAEIADFLAAGGGVILGRAAAVVLGKHGAFHVRLDGPKDRRAIQGATIEGVDLEEARVRLRAGDGARSAFVRRLYRVDPADASLYHLVIDTTAVPLEVAVELILGAARSVGVPSA